ncbi:MAG TPA: DUF2798 domain-containing protein [Octadecabacter sp.]|nr:DUF2798 domain-containing protein [Octadecabacter sp.]
MIPARYAPILFGFILSGFMSAMVSAIAVYRSLNVDSSFLATWFGAWMSSWIVAFPVVLVVAPVTRRLVAKLTK